MNVWDWVRGYAKEAQAAGDQPRLKSTAIHPVAYRIRETEPDRALALFDEGRRQAVALNEPWWILFFDHWRATALIHWQRDFRSVLDLTVRMVLDAEKPQFEQHPLRLAAVDDLIAAYLGIDPLGHADAIVQAMDHVEQNLPPGPSSCRYLLNARRRSFAMVHDDLPTTARHALDTLALADSDSDRHRAQHFSVCACNSLCEIAWKKGDWAELDRQARVGEELARQVGHQLELSEMLLYRGLAAWQLGDREDARRQVRTALARLGRLGMPPHPIGFDALVAFYEYEGDLRTMLAVRNGELAMLTNKGRIAYESKVRIKRCRLLAQLGEPLDQELAAVCTVAGRLKKPAPDLAELERIASGV